MKIHIFLTTYNNEKTIIQTIQSLLIQTYQNFELTIVDNASSDNTIEKIRSLNSKQINMIINPINIGAEKNFEKCLSLATHDLFAIFHADDLYHPFCLEEVIRIFKDENQCSALAFNADIINEKGELKGKRFTPPELRKNSFTHITDRELFSLSIKYGNFITCPGVVFRTAFVHEFLHHWRGDIFKTSADLDVWLRTARLGNFYFLNKELMSYRESQASLSYQLSKSRTEKHHLFLVLDYYKSFYPFLFWDDQHYEFLRAKDNIFRSVISLNKKITPPHFCIFWPSIILCSLTSIWHFKFSLYIFSYPFFYLYAKSPFFNWKKNES
jgi:glycosyltransferase involved in cell wall biosynthesis